MQHNLSVRASAGLQVYHCGDGITEVTDSEAETCMSCAGRHVLGSPGPYGRGHNDKNHCNTTSVAMHHALSGAKKL